MTLNRGRDCLLGAAVVAVLCAPAMQGRTSSDSPGSRIQSSKVPEFRAMWVLRTSLTSPERVTSLVRSARLHGFNTLLVQVRGRGDAYYRDGLEPLAADLARQPATFDPLASILTTARAHGI